MGRIFARRAGALAVGIAALAACFGVQAQDYPSRPVTLVAPYAAGGGLDVFARALAAKFTERLGQSFVVENRTGAGGVIAAASVAKATPDGYTLFAGSSGQLAIAVTLHKKLPYDPAGDFVPVGLVGNVPFMLIVDPRLPVKSVPDLIKLAKEKPNTLSFGSSGVGGPPHLFMELFKSMTGTAMTHVPYRGTAPALTDLVAGHLPLLFCDLAPAVEMFKDGKVRALGVSSSTRLPFAPDIPTVAEAGVPGFDAVSWIMVVAPKGTPAPIVAQLNAALRATIAQPEVREQMMTKMGILPVDSPSPAELEGFLKTEIVRWGKVVQAAGVAGSE